MTKNYIAVIFSRIKPDDVDVLIAMLADIGFDGFEETGNVLKAYMHKELHDKKMIQEIADEYGLTCEVEEVRSQNWNAVWESNFEPVVIDNFVAVRAHFHETIPGVQYEIVITPKMSFGTGHHATTAMMIQQMRGLDFAGKTVLDFGTGTGILSILAEKLGAGSVLAIDNDEWSIENSKENIERNGCTQIRLEMRNDANVNGVFDVILANINRNVIIDNLSFLASQMNANSHLLLSGLLAEDEETILLEANHYQLRHINTVKSLQWISLLFSR